MNPTQQALFESATLRPRNHGIARINGMFGMPKGVWIECGQCAYADLILGSQGVEWSGFPATETAEIFRRNGWTGEGASMTSARCARCSQPGKPE